MTGDRSRLLDLSLKEKGYVTYGDNNKGKILGHGTIGNASQAIIENVLYVEGLEHNLLSISQLCDKGNQVSFNSDCCVIRDSASNNVKFVGHRINNIYMVNLDDVTTLFSKSFTSKEDDIWLWHRRVAHIHVKHLDKLSSKELVEGLPKLNFKTKDTCDTCQRCKQVKNSSKKKNVISTSIPLELLHMDLFGPSQIMSFGGSYYALVIVDNFSRFTWTLFLNAKSDAFKSFKNLAKQIQNQLNLKIVYIRSDHGGEFENFQFEKFCSKHGILHQFSAPRTPQQNGVVERKNRVLEELDRLCLTKAKSPNTFGLMQFILHAML
ncbi:unnamed protein product [Lupinus luteus]|uniref:Integrase catalytic domain-containing protein n=1 Tax=Lupinus luteus TaxID=3873 RepID=A0AAV1WX71_LUPLU